MKTTLIAGAAACVALGAISSPSHSAIVGGRVRADATPQAMLAEINTAFEAFKTENNARLDAIEKKGAADPLTSEKVDAIVADIDKLNAALRAAQLAGGRDGRAATPERAAYDEAFTTFFRTGDRERELKALAVKAAVSKGDDTKGGYFVSSEIEAAVDRVLGTVSVMRQLATVRTIGSSTYKKRTGLGGATSGWVGEKEERPKTETPTLSELEFPAMTIYANPEATQEMLEDADLDIAEWLSGEVDIEFMEQEGAAFAVGNGLKRPRGLLAYDTVDDSTWSWGKVGFVASGHATLLNDADKLMDLTTAIKQGYRNNASWLCNRKTAAVIRKMKDADGNYLWERDLKSGQPNNLLGYPVYDDDNFPDIGAGALPLAFGDFKRAYLVVDRRGVQVLRDPYTNKPYVSFYTTKRVGGGVQNFQAFKLLKIAA